MQSSNLIFFFKKTKNTIKIATQNYYKIVRGEGKQYKKPKQKTVVHLIIIAERSFFLCLYYPMDKLTLEDMHLFHNMDREVFTKLLIQLTRDPAESLLIISLWLCLEDLNYRNMIYKIKSLPIFMLDAIVTEAVICLKCLESNIPPPPPPPSQQKGFFSVLPMTETVAGKEITLIQIYQNKYTIIAGIKTFLNKVCAVAFTDILVEYFRNHDQDLNRALVIYDRPLTIPGFPHPTFGNVTIIPRRPNYVFPSQGSSGWSLNIEVPVDDRSLFLTFSRGYPVTEEEIRELFTIHYGENCVDEVFLEPPLSPTTIEASASTMYGEQQQRLYARLVLRDVTTIDKVLSKGPIAKYKINGKHVWARKFERR